MPKNNKLFVYILLFAFLVLIALSAKFLIDSQTKKFQVSKEVWDGEFYTREGDVWQPLSKDYILENFSGNELATLPEKMSEGNSRAYRQMIRGYLIEYQRDSNTLIIRSSLPGSNFYRDISIKLSPNQTIYCWPDHREGIDVKKLFFDLNTPPIISLPEEKPLVFEAALPYLDLQSFFIIQLQQDIDPEEANEAIKIVWLCE